MNPKPYVNSTPEAANPRPSCPRLIEASSATKLRVTFAALFPEVGARPANADLSARLVWGKRLKAAKL